MPSSNEHIINTISDSLEQCAEAVGDITAPVYNRFFAQCGDAEPLMGHSDEGMKGRMLAQVIELLLTDEHLGNDGYLRWEVDNHLLAYGVDVGMYPAFFEAVRDTVKDSLGTAWGVAQADAWSTRIKLLLQDVYTQAEAQA